jgi:hypothetical protein
MNAFRSRFDAWKRSLSDNTPVTQLAEVVSTAFENYFTGNPRFVLTSQQLDYFDRVMEELEHIAIHMASVDRHQLLDRIDGVLLSLNFNVRSYCLHYIDQVTLKLKTHQSIDERIETLHYYGKIIGQIRCERGLKYYDHYSGVKDFIGGWLTEEITWFERKDGHHNLVPETSQSDYFENGSEMKILLDTSVAKLACMTRALVERGIILNCNVSDLSRIMSKFTVTRRSENVSVKSFCLRY